MTIQHQALIDVPAGFVLVPKVPTQQMIDAVATTMGDKIHGNAKQDQQIRQDWEAMLNAAPPAIVASPVAFRQWSSKWHDWIYATSRGDLRDDTETQPLYLAAPMYGGKVTDRELLKKAAKAAALGGECAS
jgi:hypothetical protein